MRYQRTRKQAILLVSKMPWKLITTSVKLITWICTSKCNHSILAHTTIRRKKDVSYGLFVEKMLWFINSWSNQQFILWWRFLQSVVISPASVNTGMWLDNRQQLSGLVWFRSNSNLAPNSVSRIWHYAAQAPKTFFQPIRGSLFRGFWASVHAPLLTGIHTQFTLIHSQSVSHL